jgi:hypothetical protein
VFTTAELSPGYLRYLERRLREAFGFAGTPLDVGMRVRTRWEERPGVPGPGKKRGGGKGGGKGKARRG